MGGREVAVEEVQRGFKGRVQAEGGDFGGQSAGGGGLRREEEGGDGREDVGVEGVERGGWVRHCQDDLLCLFGGWDGSGIKGGKVLTSDLCRVVITSR